MHLLIPEILAQAGVISSRTAKIAYLRKNGTQALKDVLKTALDPQIQLFTSTIPKYRPDGSPEGLSLNSLFQEARRLYIFHKDFTKINDARKTQILQQILESVHPTEAALIEDVFKKRIPYRGITPALVLEAFPGLFAPPAPKKRKKREDTTSKNVLELAGEDASNDSSDES